MLRKAATPVTARKNGGRQGLCSGHAGTGPSGAALHGRGNHLAQNPVAGLAEIAHAGIPVQK